MEKFYITTAIAYTSRKPHIGNTYEVVLTDAIARYKRNAGFDVFFLTGTDEHGQKIQDIAKEQGITEQQLVDKVAGQIKDIWDLMDTTYDKFIRTTDPEHKRVVANIFKKLYDQGDIYKSEYSGLYCTPCESFFTQTQAEDGICPDCKRPLTSTKEEAYFFKMSKYQDALLKHIEQNPDFIVPLSRKREMVNNFLVPGLQDLCVSRTSFTWGVPVEFDPGHIVYVWIDALSNYITALGYDIENQGDLYKKYWPADVHVIGKDILRFHTIYWPIILMALGQPLPKQVFGHPWLMSGEDKMSKSKGNVMYADDLADDFSVSAIRYYLLSEMPYANDGTITYQNIIARYNSDLANTLGNLVSRTVAMCEKYFEGNISKGQDNTDFDDDLKETIKISVKTYKTSMDEFKTSDAVASVMDIARRANKYIDETMPWALAKEQEKTQTLKTVIYNLIETIRILAVLIEPIMPAVSKEIFAQIGQKFDVSISKAQFLDETCGTVVRGDALFLRLDEDKKIVELQEKYSAKLPQKEEITIEDFAKMDFKVAKVVECEKIEKSDKLLKLKVQIGPELRQIVSGIALHYKPEELIGKNVIVITNLKQTKIRGVDSYGMLLAASNEEVLRLCVTDGEIDSGAGVK